MTSQIDLSKYVGKNVRVTLSDGVLLSGVVKHLDYFNCEFPFGIASYTFDKNGKVNPYGPCIIHIEEIQMNNFQELENKVKELQAEIDRLKAQEQKSKPRTLYDALIDDFDVDDCEIICHNVENWLPPDDPHDGEEFQLGWNACLGYLRDKIK